MGKSFRIVALSGLLIGVSPSFNEPFGIATIPAPDDALTTIWRGLQPGMHADEQMVSVCRANPSCGSPAALQFITIVDEASPIGGINAAMLGLTIEDLG